MTERARELSEKSVIPIQLGLLLSLVIGIFYAGVQFNDLSRRFEAMEGRMSKRWVPQMEAEIWQLYTQKGTVTEDDVTRIQQKWTALLSL